MEHVHLIGIGGSGLSAIARVLLERGVVVSGSDRQASAATNALQAAGVRVSIGHSPENILDATTVVRSSAIPDHNVEVQAALQQGIPVMKRAEYLGRLLDGYKVIAIAGTHGKTTTTAMIATTLVRLGQDPSYIIGGTSTDLGTNAHSGKGPLFVIEADEYDRMFLGLLPAIAVVTNVEHDHPDCYPTPQEFYQAFVDFSERILPDGLLIGCIDDPGARRLLDQARESHRTVRSYGLNHWQNQAGPDYAARSLEPNSQGGYSFQALRLLKYGKPQTVSLRLHVPGRHNVTNALAAMAVADCLDLPLEEAGKALSEYQGVGRRFEVRGEAGGITVVDDYAHHPSEIRATLAAARARYRDRGLWVVWQPHTYSRTRTLLDEFAAAFEDANHLLLTDIFAAREAAPEDGFSSRQVLAAIRHPDVHDTPTLEKAVDLLVSRLRRGDVLLVLSAGDADQISGAVLEKLIQIEQVVRSEQNV